ncbi:hypothetical protein [Massilia sp. 9096]|uniref:hypothetical protein n=1 Tax=Massilia sp. 9096 TaxID=1500894 RepID=UPI00055D06E8|nr:hypothetical protein [Massilia sp. 9096]
MTNVGDVYFALDGDEFEPDEVSECIGLAATEVRRKALNELGRRLFRKVLHGRTAPTSAHC